MLSTKLMGCSSSGLIYVGGRTATGNINNTNNLIVTLSGELSGGLSDSPEIGDYVISVISMVTNSNPNTAANNYTERADIMGNGYTNKIAHLGVYTRILTGDSDDTTSITFSVTSLVNLTAACVAIHVWRYYENDQTFASTFGSDTLDATPPAVTTVRPNSQVIQIMTNASASIREYTNSGLDNWLSVGNDAGALAMGSTLVPTTTTYTPPTFTTSMPDFGGSWIAASYPIST